MASPLAVIVTAHNEADRLPTTLAALARAFGGAPVWVADDASTDATARVARDAGAHLVSTARRTGKGQAATLAARRLLEQELTPPAVVLLCDGDLGDSAELLVALTEPVGAGELDLAVAMFSRRRGGGLGVAVGFARIALRRLCGLELKAPISGQRAVRGDALGALLPFAARFGMEMGMTVDAVRAGLRLGEVEVGLVHRATGPSPAGFLHRGRQLADFLLVYLDRRTRQ